MLEMYDFSSNVLSKNMPRLHTPLVGTKVIDRPTVRLGAANFDCRCLVLTQMQSVLSAFSLCLTALIYKGHQCKPTFFEKVSPSLQA